jgi:hypothetical protein
MLCIELVRNATTNPSSWLLDGLGLAFIFLLTETKTRLYMQRAYPDTIIN